MSSVITQEASDPSAPILVWLRSDLRVSDNPALAIAASSGAPIIPVYIKDADNHARPMGRASAWWLGRSLASLATSLEALGAPLVLRRGPAAAVVDQLIAETGARQVVWNRVYHADAIARDRQIKAQLTERGIGATSYNAALLNEPWTVTNSSGAGYQVFSAFWRAARAKMSVMDSLTSPKRFRSPDRAVASDRLDDWGLQPMNPDWTHGFKDWTPGEAGAAARLNRFLDAALASYPRDRNRPDLQGTSKLSPHLSFGEIGPRAVWQAVQRHSALDRDAADKFLSELGWREFNYHIQHQHPDLATINLRRAFDKIRWRDDEAGFTAWARGRTGYPLVDAGMRELWATGWMHNRVRMVVASFLVKHLMIDWRHGEAWFWDTLLDADPAQNAGNWQWVAGSGADAAPYFRIFNPVKQGMTFDPQGDYVRQWVPEIAGLSNKVIHAPWLATEVERMAAGIQLGRHYPMPIVDHVEARERALAMFATLKAAA